MSGFWEIVATVDEYGRGRLVIIAGGRSLVLWGWPWELRALERACSWRNDTIRRAALLEAAA